MRKILHTKRYILLVVVVALVMGLVLPGCAPTAPAPARETVKIGYLGPLSGPAAAWFLPGKTGIALWLDEIEAAGGLRAGDKVYDVEFVYYDEEAIPSKAIEGARKLVLADKVKYLMMQAGASITAVQPFVNEQEMLVTTWCSFDNDDKRPWTYGITESWPEYHTACLQWMFDNYPDVKTCAHAAQDEEVSWMSTAALEAVCEVNDVELVYNRLYSVETIDFAPIVSAMLATKPDMLSFVGAYPEFRAACMEQAYLQGFSGPIYIAEYEQSMILDKVPVEFVQDTVSSHPKMNDPMVTEQCHEFYDRWMARFGPGAPEDVHAEMYLLDYYSYETLKLWQWAVAEAGSIEPAAVKAVWDTADADPAKPGRQIPGHMYGTGTWWGEKIWGINHALLTPMYVQKCTMPNGDAQTMAVVDVADWIMKNEDVFIKHMEAWGCMYYQRD